MNPRRIQNGLALGLIGFTATSGQIFLLREFMSTFHGNELVIGIYLSVWLFATALGSGPLARLFLRRGWGSRASFDFAVVQCLVSASLLFAAWGFLAPPSGLSPALGEVAGLMTALVCSGVFLLPLCLFQGLLFPLGTRLSEADAPEVSISRVYLLEAAGAAAGGLLCSLVLIRLLSSFQIAALLCSLNLVSAGMLFGHTARTRLRQLCAVVAAVGVVFCVIDPVTHRATSLRWGALRVVATRQSGYGNLVIVSIDSQFSLYQDGLLVFTTGDVQSAEESAHIPLLQHRAPERVLLIGGGMGGVVREILKHRSVKALDYVELDPELIALSMETLPEKHVAELADPRVALHFTDGRRFLRESSMKYDVVTMHLPPPYTAQLNRFYTVEFFDLVRKHLNPGGVFSLGGPGVSEYISKELADFLASLSATAGETFSETVLVPVGRSLLVCSPGENRYLTADPEQLLSRLAERNIETTYVRSYFLSSMLSAERLEYAHDRVDGARRGGAKDAVGTGGGGAINRDMKPIGFYYDLVLWSAEYENVVKPVLTWVFENPWSFWWGTVLAAVGLVGVGVARRQSNVPVLSALVVSGFAAMVLELEIVLAFQLLYGNLYDRIGVLLTSYMVGLAIGAAIERARVPADARTVARPARIQAATAVFALGFLGAVQLMGRIESGKMMAAVEWLFPLFAVVVGGLGGALFGSASRAFWARSRVCAGSDANRKPVGTRAPAQINSGLTYAWDLVGSWLGAILSSAILFPVAGIETTTIMITVLLVASVGSLAMSCRVVQ